MSAWRWLITIALIALFVFAKAWVIHHPKGTIAAIVGAILLVVSEPAKAG